MTLKRKTVILLSKDDIIEAWGSLKKACVAHPEIKYNTITKFALPCEFKGWTIERVAFNPESNED